MTNPNDPSGPPYGEQPDPTQPPADPGHSPASPPAWQQPQQQQPQEWPQQPPQEPQQPQQPPNQGWEQQPGWGQQPPPPPGGWPPPQQPPGQQQPQGAQAWDQPTQAIGWSPQPQQQAWEQQAPQPTQVWGQEQQQPWGQQQQSWQPPGYPGADPGRTRSRSTLPLIVIGGVVLILALVGVLGFVAPGFFVKKVFDASAVQTGVTTILTNDYKLTSVSGVTCPAQQEVKVGATFTCTASVDGSDRTVPITVKTSDGSYEVGRPT